MREYVHGPDLPLSIPSVLKLAMKNFCDVATPDDYLATVERTYTFPTDRGPEHRRGKCALVSGFGQDIGWFQVWVRVELLSLDVNTYNEKRQREEWERQRGYVY